MWTKSFIIVLSFFIASVDSVFYLYDRNHNRAIRYDFTDCGNIYYTSANFHSGMPIRTNSSILLLRNRSKSLPNLTYQCYA